jgi:hypothetical protein
MYHKRIKKELYDTDVIVCRLLQAIVRLVIRVLEQSHKFGLSQDLKWLIVPSVGIISDQSYDQMKTSCDTTISKAVQPVYFSPK